MQIKLSNDAPLSKSSAILSGSLAILTALGPAVLDILAQWFAMPAEIRDAMPSGAMQVIAVVAFLAIVAARCTVLVPAGDKP